MSTTNKKNFNISKINGLTDTNDNLSSVTINNSIKIPKSSITTNSTSNNANAGILIKDVNSTGSGDFYNIKVDSSATDKPQLYFNSNAVIESGNLLGELEDILANYPLETSNIIVDGGYINFFNGSTPNTNQGPTGVGLRYSINNTVQFKNYDTTWIDLVDITKHDQFSELVDVEVGTLSNPLLNNQYITYNSTKQKYVNSNLAIINDITPRLGGDLKIGSNLLQFGSNTNRLVYNSTGATNQNIIDNNLLVLKNNTIHTNTCNYLEISNADHDNDPNITAKGQTDSNVGLSINTTGIGSIILNAQNGNIYANTDALIISGFVTNSIYRTRSRTGGYSPGQQYNIPLTNDTILFDFVNSSPSGTYWANVGAGFSEGQKLNLIYNNIGSNSISVLANFGTNGVITGTGFINGLKFTNLGQSASLVYLGNGINAWQILNTGSGVF